MSSVQISRGCFDFKDNQTQMIFKYRSSLTKLLGKKKRLFNIVMTLDIDLRPKQ